MIKMDFGRLLFKFDCRAVALGIAACIPGYTL